jgi:transposase
MLLRFVDGRPVSAVTTQFLAWLAAWLAAEGKTALLLVWDHASWHVSQAVRAWLKEHNRHVKQTGGCRVVVCPLPVKSPWLNRIEPKWVHGKRAMAEPDRKLSVAELKHRICAYPTMTVTYSNPLHNKSRDTALVLCHVETIG